MSNSKKHEDELARYFKGHVARKDVYISSESDQIEVIWWKKPNTVTGMILYLRKGNTLFISGDHEEATYAWLGDSGTLNGMSECDLHYFASKCTASPSGRGFRCWDSFKAERVVRAYFEDNECHKTYEEAERYGLSVATQGELLEFLSHCGDEYLDDNWRDLATAGDDIAYSCCAHLVGLKMAITQIESNHENQQNII